MESYDIVYPQALKGEVWGRLGFKRIVQAGVELRTSSPGAKGIEGSLCIGPSGEALNAAAKQSPRAILISDSRMDRKLLDTMRAKRVTLCIAFDRILGSAGLRRSSGIFMTSRLAQYAIKRGIPVAFVSMANSEEMLCSPIQLLELIKLLGVSEEYAKIALGVTNAELVS